MVFRSFVVGGQGDDQVADITLRKMQAQVYDAVVKRYKMVDVEDLGKQRSMKFYQVSISRYYVALVVSSVEGKYADRVRISGNSDAVSLVVGTLDLENLAEEKK